MSQHKIELVRLVSLRFPFFKHKKYPNCTITLSNIFTMALGLYMIAVPNDGLDRL